MSAIEPLPACPPGVVFDVLGVPGPQGSKKPVGQRRTKSGGTFTVLAESSKKVKPWREAVAAAGMLAMAGAAPFDEPVAVRFDFWMPRPSGTRVGDMWKTKYPDVDKLARSTFDALKMGGVVRDDSLIVSAAISKRMVPHVRGRRGEAATGARISVVPLGQLERDAVDVEWVLVPAARPTPWG